MGWGGGTLHYGGQDIVLVHKVVTILEEAVGNGHSVWEGSDLVSTLWGLAGAPKPHWGLSGETDVHLQTRRMDRSYSVNGVEMRKCFLQRKQHKLSSWSRSERGVFVKLSGILCAKEYEGGIRWEGGKVGRWSRMRGRLGKNPQEWASVLSGGVNMGYAVKSLQEALWEILDCVLRGVRSFKSKRYDQICALRRICSKVNKKIGCQIK